jgi:hypothetical protein
LSKQVFSVDETSLFQKHMPAYIYSSKDQDNARIQGIKDHVTLLWNGNGASFKLKLFLIYHSERPKPFKHLLPV